MNSKQENQIKGKILQALRKITYTNPDRKNAFDEAKVETATHECTSCGTWCYKGKSKKNFDQLVLDNPDKSCIMEGAVADHVDPVIPIEGFGDKGWCWNTVIDRMQYCGLDGWQILCKSCHKEKTDNENKIRRKKK